MEQTWRPVESGAHVARVAVLPGTAAAASAAAVLDDDGVAEVAEPQLSLVAVDEEVGRLDVAVAHAVTAVEVLEGAEHLRRVRHRVLVRQAACFLGIRTIFYNEIRLLLDLGWSGLTLILVVPPSARFCLG